MPRRGDGLRQACSVAALATAVLRPVAAGVAAGGHADSRVPGVFAARWAARAFSREDMEGGVPLKLALADAFRDACAKLRVWVP